MFDGLALPTAVERAAPADAVDVLASRLAHDLGAVDTSFLIADHSGGNLARFARTGGPRSWMERVPVRGTREGDVLRTQAPARYARGNQAVVYAPVTARGEAIGVIEVHFPDDVDRKESEEVGKAADGDEMADGDEIVDGDKDGDKTVGGDKTVDGWRLLDGDTDELSREVGAAAHIFAYVVVLNRRYTDLFEWGQRSIPLELAAEIQRRLLPDSFACEAAQATVAGWMEPAATVAGDTFDYSFGRATLDLSLTDAMGHGLAAALLATLVVNSLRNLRRERAHLELGAVADGVNAVMDKYADPEQFVTGLLLRVDLRSGAVSAVNAGHVPFYRLRNGEAKHVSWPADPPFGMLREYGYTVRRFQLQPGDRLLLVTDGMVERNATRVDLAAELTAAADLHPREVVQYLTRLVCDACDDQLLDDATILCLDWHRGGGAERRVASGADPDRASPSLPDG